MLDVGLRTVGRGVGWFVVSSGGDSWRGQHPLKHLYQPVVSSGKNTVCVRF
jgi:hypothetical protein